MNKRMVFILVTIEIFLFIFFGFFLIFIRSGEEIVGEDGVSMVLIPAGEFRMGRRNAVHTVFVDAFYMDKYEVTNGQYRRFVQATGHGEPMGRGYVGHWVRGFKSWSDERFNEDHQPVVCVSWEDAKEYCDWAGKRLPTEAEWEKAARGGLSGMEYPRGNFLMHDHANYYGTGGKDIWEYVAPVGSFAPNGYGLHDMAGNVQEWVADPSPWSEVLRGGSWYANLNDMRVTHRLKSFSTSIAYNMVFR